MARATKVLPFIRTVSRIGFRNAAAVAVYRVRVSRGWFPDSRTNAVRGLLFREDIEGPVPSGGEFASLLAEAEEIRAGRLRCFGAAERETGSPPDWLRDVFSGSIRSACRPWWRTADFPDGVSDIKGVWEASRFDWLLVLARAARVSRDLSMIGFANSWLNDWIERNPPYFGPNWKCGQETAIRLMQTLLAARILGQDRDPAPALVEFARTHVARIAQTRIYADAQDNNHATSEAFALFAGGVWLASVCGGETVREARSWARTGRRWLERAVGRLVFEDGGFSQYSVNYHRVLLETLSQAEVWRRRLGARPFSAAFYARADAAARWLGALTSVTNGDAPNLGANDGARPYRLDSSDYRDYRPCAQLACSLFAGVAAFPPNAWDEPLAWLDVTPPPFDSRLAAKRSRYFPDFGLALLNPRADGSGAYAFVRVPRDRFRPSHADPLHFDLWTVDGQNLLRDAGSYSYSDANAMDYFLSVAAHNTIAFDGRDPMPRISRFLFADWIHGEAAEPRYEGGQLTWSGHYRDRYGASHCRTVRARGAEWAVQDDISGQSRKVILRWRLAPGAASLQGYAVETERLALRVEADTPPLAVRLIEVPESRSYGQRTYTPGLEVEFGPRTRQIRTYIRLK